MRIHEIISKLSHTWDKLSSAPQIGAIKIGDSGIQYVRINEEIKAFSLRFAPGVLQGGKIQEDTSVREALRQLHGMIDPNEKKLIPVVVSLPSSSIFTQSFHVPNVGKDRMKESADLNLQMLSPIAPEKAYMSWQLIQELPDRYELLGAFAEQAEVNRLKSALEQEYFMPVAFEFPALGLSRILSEAGIATQRVSLGFEISSDGLEFFIIRNGALYFDYFRSWQSIQGGQREIPKAVFEAVVAQEMQRVINFSLSKFKEAPQEVHLIAPGFEGQMEEFLGKRFGLKVVTLQLSEWPVPPAWYAAVGSALRGRMGRKADRLVSLSALTSEDIFFREQAMNFVTLWRNIISVALFVLLVYFGGSAYSLVKHDTRIQGELNAFHVSGQQNDLLKLAASVTEFNTLVRATGQARGGGQMWTQFFATIQRLAQQNRITIDRIDAPSLSMGTITMTAHAADAYVIVQFKNALLADAHFTNVKLEVSQVVQLEDKSQQFPVSFEYHP